MYNVLHILGDVIDGLYRQHSLVSPRQVIQEQTGAHYNRQMSADSVVMLSEPLSVEPVPKSDYKHGAGPGLFLV